MTDKTDQTTSPQGGRRPPSLADMVAVSTPGETGHRIAMGTVVRVGVLAGLFLTLNFWQLRTLLHAWISDSNWSHGFIIPLFSLYLLFTRRDELFQVRRRVCFWGVPILVAGLAMVAYGFYFLHNNWTCQLSMTLMLFGLVLYLGGPDLAKLTWLPVFYLALAMPISPSIYTRIAYPLQELAAVSSAFLLQLSGVVLTINASHMDITSVSGAHHPLTVAEACSGVRSLMAFVALGIAMAYVEPRPIWQRITLVVAILPITIACNILRVTATATMFVIDKPELGQDFMHTFMGMILLIPALGMLLLLSWLLKAICVEDEEEDEESPEPGSAAKP